MTIKPGALWAELRREADVRLISESAWLTILYAPELDLRYESTWDADQGEWRLSERAGTVLAAQALNTPADEFTKTLAQYEENVFTAHPILVLGTSDGEEARRELVAFLLDGPLSWRIVCL